MANELRNKRVAALVDNGFEQVELDEPKKALEAAGAKVDVVSPQSGKVKGWQHTRWGDELPIFLIFFVVQRPGTWRDPPRTRRGNSPRGRRTWRTA